MYKMIVADDEELVRRGMRSSINWEEHGISIVGEAKDGIEALEKIRELNPDIIITDIRMPKMDGLELIRQAKSEFPEIKIIILSGYEDFNYAQKAIRNGAFDYLVKPIEVESVLEVVKKACLEIDKEANRVKNEQELRRMVMESLPVLRDRFLLGLVNGASKVKNIKEKFDFLNIKIKTENFVVLTIEIDDYKYISSGLSMEDRLLMAFSVKNIAEELMNEYSSAVAFELNEYSIVILSNFNSGQLNYEVNNLMDVCKKIKYYVNKYLNITVSIGIGGLYKTPDHILLSFQESQRALEYKFILGKNQTIYINDIEPDSEKENRISYPFDKEMDVISALRIGDVAGVERTVEEFFASVLENFNIDPQEMKRLCLRFVYSVSHVLIEMNLPIDEITDRNISFESEINKCETVEEIRKWSKKFLSTAAENIYELKNNKNVEFVKKAIEYIKSNYFKTFTVQDVAKAVYLTPNYLSNIFKQVTGKTVLEYMTEVKLQYARELLRDPDIKASEVSEMVGYKDPKYFSQLFKKHTGFTPSEFRCKAVKEIE